MAPLDHVLTQQTVAVAAGGALGSLGRWGVGMLLPASLGFPWATAVVNISGAVAMGLLTAWVLSRHEPYHLVRPFLGTGLLGGWTTFSALAVDLQGLLADGRGGRALAYLALTLVGGLLGLVGALTAGRAVWGPARDGGGA